MSEMFWEGVEHLLKKHGDLITGPLHAGFIREIAPKYAEAIQKSSGALKEFIGLIDATVIGVCRPGGTFCNVHCKMDIRRNIL